MLSFLLGLLYHIVKSYQQTEKIGDLSREREFYIITYTKKAASSTSPSMTLSIMGVVVQLFFMGQELLGDGFQSSESFLLC